jgi:type VI protein secretion system component Hcp
MLKKLVRLAVGAICFSGLLLSGTPALAQDYTIKIGDIQGSSILAGAEGSTDVFSFSFGVISASPSGKGGNTVSAIPSCSQFNTMVGVGKETGDLFLGVIQGTRYETATFKVWKFGVLSYELTFSDVVLTSLQQSGSEGGGGLGIFQSLSMSFARVHLKTFSPVEETDLPCGR